MQLPKPWVSLMAILIVISMPAFSQNAQDEEIKKVIASETDAFFKRNAEAWQATWLHDAKATRTNTNLFESTSTVGWDAMSTPILKFIKDNPSPDSIELSTDSFNIRTEGNMAVADFKAHVKFLKAQPPFSEFSTREQRVLVKRKGKWLIASSTTNDITTNGMGGMELTLNGAGYTYLFAGKTDEAIKLLELNAALFPDSFNVWDSLGEAYAKAGNKEKAREYYQKSLSIFPESQSGKKALADLQ